MKTALKTSILINLGLFAAVIVLLTGRRQTVSPIMPASGPDAGTTGMEVETSARATFSSVKPQTFHWSQLEAADYKVYISNLRGIGCPELTIRDLIAADVDASVYAPRREKLNRSQVGTSASLTASLTRHALEAELQKLNDEEAALIATLLGWPVASDHVATGATADSRDQTEAVAAPVALPLVFREANLSALKLDGQANVFANLGQRFLREIGGTNQDPNDPAYRERWQRAEAKANQQLKGMIGMRAYQAFDLKTRSAALAQAAREANP